MKKEKQIKLDSIIKEIESIISLETSDTLDDIFPDEKPYDDDIFDLLNELPEIVIESIVCDGQKKEEIFTKLRKQYPGESFWEKIEDAVSKRILSFYDTEFIRMMSDEKRQYFFDKVIEWNVIYSEKDSFIMKELDITKEQLEIAKRVINTLNQIIIIRHSSKRMFFRQMILSFGLNDTDSELIWTKYEQNKRDIQFNCLIHKMKKQENEYGRISEAIEELLKSK